MTPGIHAASHRRPLMPVDPAASRPAPGVGPGPRGPGTRPSGGIRRREVFDSAGDLGEVENLARHKPRRRAALATKCREHLPNLRAQMSVCRQTGKRAPPPA